MHLPYSYSWYIQQFKKAKDTSETFLLSVDDRDFLRPPADDQWAIAECYDHLIKFGYLYLQNMEPALAANYTTTDNLQQPFKPRWITRKVISFFAPPYKMKVKTFTQMKPAPVSGYNRMELLNDYISLQDRLIAELEKGQQQQTNLGAVMVEHPIFSILKMTLSECFAIVEVHQRRHQWQAEQTLKMLEDKL
ncbi:DinB family protein [Fodinibius salsisoli]|uniref:DinB family protein n=1 Tax=Fodinibius salsisoli TaxID=2820877 RepID=A0ABT3PPR5_9BACT|nr:DinB family protein [Fodinibius salsisoli]MCW9707848.1 DinB family protein [Fodinibius salsisoli]